KCNVYADVAELVKKDIILYEALNYAYVRKLLSFMDPFVLDAAFQDDKCSAVSSLLVLYTGGTIGMRPVNGTYDCVPNLFVQTLKNMPTFSDQEYEKVKERPYQKTSDQVFPDSTGLQNERFPVHLQPSQFTTFALPLTKDHRRIFYSVAEYSPLVDSSDMTQDDWVRIARDIGAYYDFFDGFVILHGTDTLAYTAAALSFMFENLGKPVILTGSQLPIFEFRSDGWGNFLGALLIAGGSQPIPEVTVFFHDNLFRGSRVVKCSSDQFHAFASPNFPALAVCGTEITFFPELVFRPPAIDRPFSVHTGLCRDVAILNMFPSVSTEHVAAFLAPPTKGVVLRTYGAGNVPASRKDLLELFRSASERGVLIINVTQCYRGGVKAVYSTGAVLNECGVIPGYDITTEAALTKLTYVLGKVESSDVATQRSMLSRSLRGEVTIGSSARLTESKLSLSDPSMLERKAISYLAHVFTEAQHRDMDTKTAIWARRLITSFACEAAASNDIAMLEDINEALGHLQLSDTEGCSTLHKAARHGHIQAVRFLLRHGVSVYTKDLWGLTPLDHAIQSPRASFELVMLLLHAGARLALSDFHVPRAVNAAAGAGDIKRLRLYRLAGCTLEEWDSEGRSAIHVAVANRHLETVRFLVSPCTLDLNHPRDLPENSLDVHKYLISGAGVHPSTRTSWQTTALDEARLRGFTEICELLESTLPLS
ncbi:L-asparaginase, type I, partial [Opisthorchis viverrini]